MSDIQAQKDVGWSAGVAVRKSGYNDIFISDMRKRSKMLDLFFKNYNYKYKDEEND